ncbi:MAG: protein-export chaperone SecB [Rhodospirillales bacterium]|nr:MAG: protein-export chaperone SecB [Rhodospirillales bacterium]
MTDTPETPAGNGQGAGPAGAGDGAPTPPPLAINAQYIKDLSFEAPTAPGIFGELQKRQPDINVNVNVQATPLGNNAYEVVLVTRAECKLGESTAFLTELSYGGVFTLNVPQEHLRPVLLIECPRILFPFARHILANTTREGGFLPLMLGPIDFVAMYQRHAQQQQAAVEAASDQGGSIA